MPFTPRRPHSKRLPSKTSPEHQHQTAFFRRLAMLDHPARDHAFAIPNGALSTKAARLFFTAEGVKAGVPDVFLAYPHNGWGGLWLEFKWGDNTMSPKQVEWFRRLQAVGYQCREVRSWQEAINTVLVYLGILGEG